MKKPKHIIEQISSSKNLPSLPQILLRLIEACNDDSVPLEELSRIIAKEPSLCAKVMRLINSPFVGLGNKINTIDQAVLYLGSDTIKNLAISASVLQAFKNTGTSHVFDHKYFWYHSFTCALVARKIAKKMSYFAPEEAFLAGLLHDIGKLVLLVNFKKDYEENCGDRNSNLEFSTAFEKKVNITHSEAGAYIIREWKLKSLMADSVFYHHDQVQKIEDAFPLVKIIYTANSLSHEGDEWCPVNGFAAAKTLFGLNSSESENILDEARQETTDVAATFDIDIAAYSKPVDTEPDSGEGKGSAESQEKLVSEVVDITMMHGTLQNLLLADSKAAILKIVENGLRINFDIETVFFFLHDKEKNVLSGYLSGEEEAANILSDLVIQPDNNNMISLSYQKQKIIDSFNLNGSDSLSILDEQLVRVLGTDGMICIPLVARKDVLGVISLGTTRNQGEALLKHYNRLDVFTRQASLCLQNEIEKETRVKIVKSERIDASAITASRVIHEVNNPLGIIKNYVKVLGLKLPEKHPAQDELKIISEEIDRVKLLMVNLSAFSEPPPGQKVPFNINAILSGFLKIITKSILLPAGIKLHISFDENVPKIITVKNSIKQVILNLIRNSVEALTEGGNIYITTRCLNAAGKKIAVELDQPIENVEILIRDDGPGLPEDIRNHLFEPFYTTKEGEHSGLGLSIVHSCIKEINGTISCKSSTDEGTEFSIILPVSIHE